MTTTPTLQRLLNKRSASPQEITANNAKKPFKTRKKPAPLSAGFLSEFIIPPLDGGTRWYP